MVFFRTEPSVSAEHVIQHINQVIQDDFTEEEKNIPAVKELIVVLQDIQRLLETQSFNQTTLRTIDDVITYEVGHIQHQKKLSQEDESPSDIKNNITDDFLQLLNLRKTLLKLNMAFILGCFGFVSLCIFLCVVSSSLIPVILLCVALLTVAGMILGGAFLLATLDKHGAVKSTLDHLSQITSSIMDRYFHHSIHIDIDGSTAALGNPDPYYEGVDILIKLSAPQYDDTGITTYHCEYNNPATECSYNGPLYVCQRIEGDAPNHDTSSIFYLSPNIVDSPYGTNVNDSDCQHSLPTLLIQQKKQLQQFLEYRRFSLTKNAVSTLRL